MACSRWSRVFVKYFTIFEDSSTEILRLDILRVGRVNLNVPPGDDG